MSLTLKSGGTISPERSFFRDYIFFDILTQAEGGREEKIFNAKGGP